MKKILATVITLMMLIGCVIIAAFPTSAVEIDYDQFDMYVREDDNENAENGVWIAEYLGEDKEVIVPSIDPDGEPIIGVDYQSFVNNKTIETVYLCEGLKQVGDYAFKNCAMLQHVSLPYSLKDLGRCNVFQYTSISSMVIPGQVEEIPCCLIQSAGKDRGGLEKVAQTDIVISYGVKKIKQGAFFYDGDAPLIFPSTMTNIRGAFDIYRKKTMDVYILNPKCTVGEVLKDFSEYKPNTNNNDPSYPYKYKKGEMIPPVLIWGDNGVVKIHGPKNSVVKAQVNDWNKQYGKHFEFIEMTDAEVKEKDQWTKDNGIVKSTGWEMEEPGIVTTPDDKKSDDGGEDAEDTDDADETTSGNTTSKKKKDKNNGADGEDTEDVLGLSVDWTKYLIIGGIIFAVIVIAIVVVLILVLNKGKKKKKKKAVKEDTPEEIPAETPAEELPVDETPTEE